MGLRDPEAAKAYSRAQYRKRRDNPNWKAEKPTVEERFWSKVNKTDTCWLWKGWLNHGGYGRFFAHGREGQAHRFAYEMLVGAIPEGLHIDHLCRNRACVNPQHLEPVTSKVNTLRGKTPAAANKAKTHCTKGHEFTLENTYLYRGGRLCKECNRQASRKKRAKAAEVRRVQK